MTIRALKGEVDFYKLSPEQQKKYQQINKDFYEILSLELKPTGIFQKTKNEILQIPKNARNA
jgi:hypothetical protein